MHVWEFDVALSTHDALKRGITALRWVHVVIASDDAMDAHLAAAQLAGCHGMVTEVRYRE